MPGAASSTTRNPVGRAFRILAWMAAREDGPFGLREIAKGVEMNPSTVHRLLGLLEEEGLVRQDDHGGAYGLGPELLRLARLASGTHPAHVAALPAMRELAEASGETVTFGLYDPVRRQLSVAAVVESDAPFRYVPELDEWRDVHTGASGRAVMAFLPEEERRLVVARTKLAPATEHTITSEAELEEVLRAVRVRGYAFSREERRIGGVGIASPVFGPGGKVLGEVGVSVPTQRFDPADEERLAALVTSCAETVTSVLGG
ncbi:MAG: IclR family transcriptional regulator [Gaiellales bacterium]